MLTPESVRALGDEWFAKLDEHAREVELLALLADEGLQQHWPDYEVKSLDDFEGWYQRALRLFFNETHTLKTFDVTVDEGGQSASVKLVVNWKADTWNPGDKNSKHLDMDAYQTWTVTLSQHTQRAVIQTITVDDVQLQPGSASLDGDSEPSTATGGGKVPNTDLVFKMYDYFGKGDMDSIKKELFHPDMTWTMPGHHPLSAKMEGVDSVIAFFSALFQAGIEVTDAHFGELDDGTVVEKHTGHGKIGDQEFIFPTCTTYGIQDGLIHEVRVHTGDQHTVDRYMWSVFQLKGVPERLA